MRKYIHTALVISLLALPCFGQFSEIWTNGDLFKVNEMASQCYSASVERCVAVGVTPDSPSWYDYLLGKNHAKLASVKANITACWPYYADRSILTDGAISTNGGANAIWWHESDFLGSCGLSTNAISETPWFKSQYASVTGGWVNTWIMLTNLTITCDPYYSVINGLLFTNINTYSLISAGNSTNSLVEAFNNASTGQFVNTTSQGDVQYSYTKAFYYTSQSRWFVYLYKYSQLFFVFSQNTFEYHGKLYSKSVPMTVSYSDYNAQGDNVSTNYVNYLDWTNAIGQTESPSYYLAGNPTNYPTQYIGETNANIFSVTNRGYKADDSFDASTTFVRDFIATTNGFKYR
jgi:hypothetical protein